MAAGKHMISENKPVGPSSNPGLGSWRAVRIEKERETQRKRKEERQRERERKTERECIARCIDGANRRMTTGKHIIIQLRVGGSGEAGETRACT